MIKLESNEKIILEIRKHWFIFFSEIAVSIILILLPIFVLPILAGFGLEIDISSVSLMFFLYSIWFLIIWIAIFSFWTNYFLDVWIVTDQKIFDVEQKGLFSREVSILHYDRIQDVTYDINGIIANVFNFGNLYVQTAGADKLFIIKGVKDPAYIQKKLNEVLMRQKI